MEKTAKDFKKRTARMLSNVSRSLSFTEDFGDLIKDGTVTVFLPINITHIADMDGIGCSILLPTLIHTRRSIFLPQYVIPVGNSGIYEAVAMHFTYIMTKIFFSELEEQLINRVKERNELLGGKKYDVTSFKIIPWLSITDVATHSTDIERAISEFRFMCDRIGLNYLIWKIDHHITNEERFEISEETVETPDGKSIPRFVDICQKCLTKDLIENNIKTNKNDMISFEFMLGKYPYIHEMLLDKRDKCAAFIYLVVLLWKDILPYREPHYYDNLIKFIYTVSEADTYSFDFEDEHRLFYLEFPTAYTMYFKFYNGGASDSNFCLVLTHFLKQIYQDISDDKELYYSKYGEYFTVEDEKILDISYNNQKSEYDAAVSRAKYMEIDKNFSFFKDEDFPIRSVVLSHIADLLPGAFNVLDDKVLRYAVFVVENGEDVSFIGNTLLKKNDNLDIALFIYPGSRILSFRANNKKEIHVNTIAMNLGGGGHPFAAGAKICCEDLISLLKIYWALPNLDTKID